MSTLLIDNGFHYQYKYILSFTGCQEEIKKRMELLISSRDVFNDDDKENMRPKQMVYL